MRIISTLSAFLLCASLSLPALAQAQHFGSRRGLVDGQEQGVVTSHGIDLFEIASAAGGRTPVQRAETVAQRLNQMVETGPVEARSLSVGYHNGEVILQRQDDAEHPPHILVTVDRKLAPSGQVERLAQWWLALLRDHLALAAGQPPHFTVGTPAGTAFRKLWNALGAPQGPVAADDIDRAVANLSAFDRERLQSAAAGVPDSFDPDHPAPGGKDVGTEAHGDNAPDRPGQPETRPGDDRPFGQPDTTPDADTQRQPRTGGDDNSDAAGDQRDPNQTPDRQSADTTHRDPRALRERTSGDYRVVLVTDPRTIHPGDHATILVRILHAGDNTADVDDATVHAWLSQTGGKAGAPVTAAFDDSAGAYSIATTLKSGGDWKLTIGVLTADGDAFRVSFPLPVRDDSAGPRAADDRTRLAGAYRLRLVTRPARLTAQGTVSIELRIRDADSDRPASNLKVTAWLLAPDDQPGDVDPISLTPGDEDGVYQARVHLGDAGLYRLSLRIENADGTRVRTTFPLRTGAPSPDTPSPDTRDANEPATGSGE